jgi:UDP-N-acetyl-D-glucosamine dehydrogenase
LDADLTPPTHVLSANPSGHPPSVHPRATHPHSVADWQGQIAARSARIGIIGMGYVGLPLALLFSEERFRVTGFDVDPTKVDSLNRGESYIYSIRPDDLAAGAAHGFRATGDYTEIAAVDAILICVPTPLHEDHTPDVSYVVKTMEAIAPYLGAGQIVVLESTTYPGTTEEIVVETINRHSAPRGVRVLRDEPGLDGAGANSDVSVDGVLVAFSPEREDPGNTVVRRRDIPKIVGGVDRRATEVARALYGSVFEQTVAMSTPAAAEMTKLLENIYRCVNIALVNELKQLCQHMGIDIWEVIEAAATKPFGFHPFYPGPGVGGHCIPVDPFYLSWKGKQHGFATRFIELAGEVNESMPSARWRGRIGTRDQGSGTRKPVRSPAKAYWSLVSRISATSTTCANRRPSSSSRCCAAPARRSNTTTPTSPGSARAVGTSCR